MNFTGIKKKTCRRKTKGKRSSWNFVKEVSKIDRRKRTYPAMLHEINSKGAKAKKPSSQSGDRSVVEIAEQLRDIPFCPQGPYILNLASAGIPDLSRVGLYMLGSRAGNAYPYPDRFEKVVFPSLDRTPLVGILGIHGDGKKRPGVVFCHGLLGSKTRKYIMEAALKAFTEWDYNVLALDLRNFGESQKLSHSPTTGGWKEGQDVLGACRFLGEIDQITTVAAVGYSLGAGSVMNAAYQCRYYPYITGGVMAWSGYASMEQMISHISNRPQFGDPFLPIYAFFLFLTEMHRLELLRQPNPEAAGAYVGYKPFSANYQRYIREVSAPHYGLKEKALYNLSSPKEFISKVDIPLMLLHAEDDPICPAEEIEELHRNADGNPNVDIWILPTGSHCAFKCFDKEWYWSVMRGFLDYWADRPEANATSAIA